MEYQQMNMIQPNKQDNKSNKGLMVAVIVLCIITISVIIGLFTYIILNDKKVEEEPILVVDECPNVIYAQENTIGKVTLSGTIRDDNFPCVLKVNGKTVETAMEKGITVNWSESFDVPAGISQEFVIELKNNNGVIVSQTRTVYCQSVDTTESAKMPSGPLIAGSEFVKKKSGGLNIREYAGTAYKVIDFINGYDYTSKMVFIGNYRVDYEGYTWYQVIAPNGKYGYVRSDLVTRVN